MTELKMSKKARETSFLATVSGWEEAGEGDATLGAIAQHAQEYETYAEIAEHLKLDIPCPGQEDFDLLASGLDLSPSTARQLSNDACLVAGFYLTPRRKAELRVDLGAHRELLARIAAHSNQLLELINRITPSLELVLKHAHSAGAGERAGLSRKQLMRTLHDISRATAWIEEELPPRQAGRPTQYLRDNTFRMAIEAAQRAGLTDLAISRGTNARPEAHLKGRAGAFLEGFFALVIPNSGTASLAILIERARRNMSAR